MPTHTDLAAELRAIATSLETRPTRDELTAQRDRLEAVAAHLEGAAPVAPVPVTPVTPPLDPRRIVRLAIVNERAQYAPGDVHRLYCDAWRADGTTLPGDAPEWGGLTFASANAAAVTVSGNGTLRVRATGQATARITATLAGASDGATIAVVAPQPTPAPAVITPTPPAPPGPATGLLPASAVAYLGIGGLTEAQVRGMGPQFVRHVDDYLRTHETMTTGEGGKWESGYYSSGATEMAWGHLLNRRDVFDRGRELALRYARDYVIVSNGVSAHWYMADALAVVALLGEPDGVRAQQIALRGWYDGSYYVDAVMGRNAEAQEARIFGRMLLVCLSAHATGGVAAINVDAMRARVPGLTLAGPNDYAGMARGLLPHILGWVTRDPSLAALGEGGKPKGFYNALLADALARTAEVFPDTRIAIGPALVAIVRALRAGSWKGDGFSYLADGGGATQDLTNLFWAPIYAAARLPGAADLRAFGDEVARVGVASALLTAPYHKQRNQSFHSTYRALVWRGA